MVSGNYKKDDDYVEVMQNTNPIILAYTTAIVRLKLYSYLEQLQDSVLYFDIDSVFYVTDLTNPSHKMIQMGWSLGEMTNELKNFGPNAYIDEFVSGGSKNYAYKVVETNSGEPYYNIKVRGITLTNSTSKKVDGRKHVCMKVKGITLSSAASKHVNFNTLKKL